MAVTGMVRVSPDILAFMKRPVLKMYQSSRHRGDSAEHWEDCWAHHSFEDALRFCEQDPLRRLFERYVPPGSRVLEGGCGAGQYVAYYTDHGRRMVGVDFARDALVRLRARRPDLPLCAANVEKLPMPTASFDAYYSGGVVEHLEHGPEQALSEAARVLRNSGVLLCSVPFYNPLRRMLAVLGRRDWEVVSAPIITAGDGERVFWQYAFTLPEFEQQLTRHGFDVVESMGYSILWGLYEIPGVAALTKAAQHLIRGRRTEGPPSVESANRPIQSQPPIQSQSSLLRRLVVSEDVTVPVLGNGVRLLRAFASNMIMFVCVKRGRPSPV